MILNLHIKCKASMTYMRPHLKEGVAVQARINKIHLKSQKRADIQEEECANGYLKSSFSSIIAHISCVLSVMLMLIRQIIWRNTFSE